MKYELFDTNLQKALFLLVMVFIFCISVGFEFRAYSEFKKNDFLLVKGDVLNSYLKTSKKGKKYRVLQIKTDKFEFYTTLHKNSRIQKDDYVLSKIDIGGVSFKEFLQRRFYANSTFVKPITKENLSFRDKLKLAVTSKHSEPKIAELYSALYLATPISRELRVDVTKWGIAHIISISGFHLGIIYLVLFFIFGRLYGFIGDRFLPYRNQKFDVSIVIFGFVLFYLWVLEFTPSFLRSVLMSLLIFFFVLRNLNILSFQTLFLTIILAFAFSPGLIFSVGFYFSCLGVLYIYIYVKHFWGNKSKLADTIWLNIFVFLAMNIPVYYFFESFSFSQVAVMPLGFVFTVFYPLSMGLHLVGYADIFDEWLLKFLDMGFGVYRVYVPPVLFYLQNLLTILGMRYKRLCYVIAIMGFYPLFVFK
ncbi:MAG: ComEC/Rec2 family competence protein [Campylobacter sp.]|nr:ComEC/Rec2 family competence protein [Campylobacter sp.]